MSGQDQNSVCQVFSEFSEVTSLQGIPFIRQAKRWYSKTIWSVIFLGAVTLWLLHSYKVCQEYYAYTTITQIEITHDTLPFPSLTLCNINPLRKTMVEDLGPDKLKKFLHTLEPRRAYRSSAVKRNMSRLVMKEEDTTLSTESPRLESNDIDLEDNTEKYVANDSHSKPHGMDSRRPDRTPIPKDRGKAENKSMENEGRGIRRSADPNEEEINSFEEKYNLTKSVLEEHRRRRFRGESEDLHQRMRKKLHRPKNKKTEDMVYIAKMEKEGHHAPPPQVHSMKGHMLGSGWTTKLQYQQEIFKDIIGNIDKELRKELGHQKEVLILECSYNGMRCSSLNFTTHLTAEYGNCYTFNSGNNSEEDGNEEPLFGMLYSAKAGVQHGLHLKLFIEHNEQLEGFKQGKGIRLAIHPSGTMPFVAENGISMATGQAAYIGLRMVNITRLGLPFPPCIEPDTYQELYGRTYTIEACVNTCLDRSISSNCSCMRPEYAEYYTIEQRQTLRACATKAEIDCKLSVIADHNSGMMDCNCLVACKSINYEILISNNDWPDESEWYELVDAVCEMDDISCEFLMRNEALKMNIMRDNFLSVFIYYQDLNYESIQEHQAYEDGQFYSDLGGAIGLWIGATMFTIVEMLDLCWRVCIYLCCTKRSQRNMKDRRISGEASVGPGIQAGKEQSPTETQETIMYK